MRFIAPPGNPPDQATADKTEGMLGLYTGDFPDGTFNTTGWARISNDNGIMDYDQGGYVLFKEMMDDRCFALMRAEVHLDAQHHVTGQKIENGESISPEEYTKSKEALDQTIKRALARRT